MSGRDRSVSAHLLRTAASVIEPLYASMMTLRNRAFDRGRRRVHRVGVPVISVGNITTGGTGKTPMVASLVEQLKAMGLRPAVLMRGYRGNSRGGSDERQVLAEQLGDVPIVAGADRVAAAKRLLTEQSDVNAIVLDDGFQHRRLGRDLDLVLIDATNPFGYGRVLPRGLLREPIDGLRRADAVIVTHADELDPMIVRLIDREVRRHHGSPPIAHAAHVWRGIVDERDEPAEPGDRPIALFCGIGNPGAFVRQARRTLNVAGCRTFADHHAYTADDLRELFAGAAERGAAALVTTQKDWVKVRRVLESSPTQPAVPVWRPRLAIDFLDGREALEQLLHRTLQAPGPDRP